MKNIVKVKHILSKIDDSEVELLNAVQEMQNEGLEVDITHSVLPNGFLSAVISGYEVK
ncbi:hypothetical protein HPT25_28145 [Bacillus sp. BRMEA1]|uniref:hypothetical protein n=1 Tax=Neobacillus endophyticus TaxID=2738405 RepID=UPI001563BD93|nr:hypothetical protein [Neobacillus endophyticus]NRD81167.1 hypothetical protein [Neobacillus endophyticus]